MTTPLLPLDLGPPAPAPARPPDPPQIAGPNPDRLQVHVQGTDPAGHRRGCGCRGNRGQHQEGCPLRGGVAGLIWRRLGLRGPEALHVAEQLGKLGILGAARNEAKGRRAR